MSVVCNTLVPVLPEVIDYARSLLKHDLSALPSGAARAGVFQEDEWILYRASFKDGVELELKIVSDKMHYYTVPVFHLPDGRTIIGKRPSAKNSLGDREVFYTGLEGSKGGYLVVLAPESLEYHLFVLEPENDVALVAKALVPSPKVDTKGLIKDATREFLQTQEGQIVLGHNCGAFNWGDAVEELPSWLCLRHGFLIDRVARADAIVMLNEQLTEE